MTRDEKKAFVQSIASRIRVTKVVCTRSVKGRNGDVFVGYSSASSSIQEDAGMGTDLSTTLSDDQTLDLGARGLTIKEAKIAGYLLGLETDVAAFEHALASGGISEAHCKDAVSAIRKNYSRLVSLAMGDD